MQILIAEDETVTRQLLSRFIKKLGFECIAVSNGLEAWEILSKPMSPSVAILDWMMPGLSGIDLCERVRKDKKDQYTYLIMLTGKTSSEDFTIGFNAGVDDYLKKPLNERELRARLRTAGRIVNQDLELRQLLGRHKTVVESIPSSIFVIDEDDLIIEWNSQATKLFGLEPEEVIGKKVSELALPWECPLIMESLHDCRRKKETIRISSLRVESHSAAQQVLDLTISPLVREQQNTTSVVIVINNITQQNELQEKLFNAQKLESIGRLSAGIAHEVNTPSQFVKNNLSFLESSFSKLRSILESPPCEKPEIEGLPKRSLQDVVASDSFDLISEMHAAITESIEGIDRVSEIVHAIGTYVHPNETIKEPVNINQLIDTCLTMTRHVWKNVVYVQRDYAHSLPVIHCCPSLLQQAIINLLVNAVHALQESSLAQSEKQISIKTHYNCDYVVLEVSDNGCGIAQENMNRIFDPFFTTKKVGEGTGQGLAIVQRAVVELHSGEVKVSSKPGDTTFTVLLPYSGIFESDASII